MTWVNIVHLEQNSSKDGDVVTVVGIVLPICTDSRMPWMEYKRAAQRMSKFHTGDDPESLLEWLAEGNQFNFIVPADQLEAFLDDLEIRVRLDWWDALAHLAVELAPKKEKEKNNALPEIRLGRRLRWLIKSVDKNLAPGKIPSIRTLLTMTDIVEELSALGLRIDAERFRSQDAGRSMGGKVRAAKYIEETTNWQAEINRLVANGRTHLGACRIIAEKEGGDHEDIRKRTNAIKKRTRNPKSSPRGNTPQ